MAADDAVQSWLSNLPRKVRRRLVEVARREANDLSTSQRSRLRSLEQPPDDTGDLEASCQVEERGDQIAVVAGGDLTTKRGYDHALAFEFGTVKQPARSFFYSTYREKRDQIRENINTAIAEAIDSA